MGLFLVSCLDCKIQNNSKRPYLNAIFKYLVKISVTSITFADIEKQVESMIKSGNAENQEMTQGLASFCFLHQKVLLFPVDFFSMKLKPL